MTRALRPLVLLATLSLPLQAAEETAIDGGVTLREAALRTQPAADASTLATLSPGTTLDVFERRGLWLRAGARGGGEAARGWLSITGVRLTGKPSGAARTLGSGLARLSRSVSSLFGGLRGRETRTAHATIGIRGLTAAELNAAQPDAAALDYVAAWRASAEEAGAFASAGGLMARAAPGDAP